MTKIADANGKVIPGLTRGSGYGIDVADQSGLTKYRIEQSKITRINKIEADVADMRMMLTEIFKAINGTHNV